MVEENSEGLVIEDPVWRGLWIEYVVVETGNQSGVVEKEADEGDEVGSHPQGELEDEPVPEGHYFLV